MKALVYNCPRDVVVREVADPRIERPTDALVQNYEHQHLRLRLAHV